MADEDYEGINTGSSFTVYMKASGLRKNGFVVIQGRPCKIAKINTSETNEVHLVGTDIFTGEKFEHDCPSNHNIEVPHTSRIEYQLLDVSDDNFLSLMGYDGNNKDDVKAPDGELGEKLVRLFREEEKDTNVIVLSAMGEDAVVEVKEAP